MKAHAIYAQLTKQAYSTSALLGIRIHVSATALLAVSSHESRRLLPSLSVNMHGAEQTPPRNRSKESIGSKASKSERLRIFSEALRRLTIGRKSTGGRSGARKLPTIVLSPYKSDMWTTDADLRLLRRVFTPRFRESWESAVRFYLEGNWSRAKALLSSSDMSFYTIKERKAEGADGDFAFEPVLTQDGPATALLKFMESHDWNPPDDWVVQLDGFFSIDL